MKKIFFLFLFSSIAFCATPKKTKPVIVGADILFQQRLDLVEGKRVAVVCNHTALLADSTHLVDALVANKKINVVAIFGPEHGVRGDAHDGRIVQDSVDEKTGIPIYSLYGKINKPTPEMLKDVDVLIYDIQDVGARFYTFISTMFLCMEAAAENNISFIVLDRPNPISGDGDYLEGPVRLDSLKSFVGWAPIPISYRLTVGELAVMANLSGWLKDRKPAKLKVIQMENWNREQFYDETNLRWVSPSPNIRTLQTAIVYPGMCLIEGTNVSEGRGTERPFEYIGAPYIDGKILTKELNSLQLPGVKFEPIDFIPEEIPHVASNPKYKGEKCGGIFVNVTDRRKYQSVKTGIAVIWAIHKLYKDSLIFRDRGFTRLMGTPLPQQMIFEGKTFNEIVSQWSDELEAFRKIRKKALLYVD